MNEGNIGFLVGIDAAIADSQLDGLSSVLSDLIGHPTVTVGKTLRTTLHSTEQSRFE